MRAQIKSAFLPLFCFAIVFVAGGIGNLATMPSIPTWYAALNKPVFNPPNWIFGPVWTLLYVLLALSLWRILRSPIIGPLKQRAIVAFALQMILNPLWSIVFFYFHAPALALGVVILLELSVLNMIRTYMPIDRVAAQVQWPYAAWVAFATILNASIVILN
jgi:benzodiazapine receptor